MTDSKPGSPKWVCAKCGMKIYAPGTRPTGTDWYCRCPIEQTPPPAST